MIFVHGCFWHLCPNCKAGRIPKTRTEWWKAKLEGNTERDKRKQKELKRLGWKVVVVWECELKNAVLEKKLINLG